VLEGESGFTSHTKSIKAIMEKLKANEAARKSTLYVLDELFRITNSVEGIALALAFITSYPARFIYPRGLIATHYATIPKWLENKQVVSSVSLRTVSREENGKPVFTYGLEQGISGDELSIPLLRMQGFDDEFLRTAEEIRRDLLAEGLITHL
jgi:DNA mismatch repair ATPase MutS